MTVRRQLSKWELVGFVFVGVVGTLLHFAYGWFGGSRLVAGFAGVNNSTWEHMKLLFLPYFVFTMVQYPSFAEPYRNYFAVKAAAGLAGMLLIPLLHYTVAGMFGAPPAWLNMAIFFLADAAMYAVVLGRLGRVEMAVTANLNINFLARPKPVDLLAEACILRLSRRQAVCEVRLYSQDEEGDLVAHVTGTYALPL